MITRQRIGLVIILFNISNATFDKLDVLFGKPPPTAWEIYIMVALLLFGVACFLIPEIKKES